LVKVFVLDENKIAASLMPMMRLFDQFWLVFGYVQRFPWPRRS